MAQWTANGVAWELLVDGAAVTTITPYINLDLPECRWLWMQDRKRGAYFRSLVEAKQAAAAWFLRTNPEAEAGAGCGDCDDCIEVDDCPFCIN